jgi:thiamine pyrophosphate-dependent acetolactate synthase large subunit-like protein
MPKTKKTSVGRRGFLKGAAAGAAVLVAPIPEASAQAPAQAAEPAQVAQRGNATAQVPGQQALARESGAIRPAAITEFIEHPGSDYMVDVLKTLDIEYLGSNPGSTFESLHESIINHGGNKAPEFLTCLHEEAAVAMAQGYFKIENKPMLALIHGPIGLQHASMAIYNTYADRVPVIMIVGNHGDAARRSQGVESLHSAQDMGALVRDYVKWDDEPLSLGHFAQSMVRAYNIAMTPPMGPVLIVANAELQKDPMPANPPRIPKLTRTSPPAGDPAAIEEAAKMLVAAERPKILTERAARSQNGMRLVTELAETLQATVVSTDRLDISNVHPLAGSGGRNYNPDLTLCLEMNDLQNETRAARARGAKVISISSLSLNHKANLQDFGHYADIDLDIGGDPEATIPELIEAIKRQMTPDRKRAIEERGKKIAEANHQDRLAVIESARIGWDSSPVSLARLCAELWPLIKDEDWSLVSQQPFIGNWPTKLWKFDKPYQYNGSWGAGGIGYNAPASMGGALANRKHGRLSVNIQCDGDLNFSPGVLWTAAHHQIPQLIIMHNNRSYGAEVMFVQRMAALHNRSVDRCHIGTTIANPNIDYAKMAEAYGVHGEGPISDPKDLSAAFKRGIEIVKKGEPAMIDVVTQPR